MVKKAIQAKVQKLFSLYSTEMHFGYTVQKIFKAWVAIAEAVCIAPLANLVTPDNF